MIAMSVRREVTLTAVQFLAVASTIAIVLYYLPNYYMYKEVVAQNSQTLMQAIGINGVTWSQGGKVFLNEFEIQRMCTGVQVIAVFLGIVVAVPKVDLKRRVMALSVVAVSVHFANVGRIALEIWLLYSGILPWSSSLPDGVNSRSFLSCVLNSSC